MADYYTQFSQTLTLDNKEQADWLRDELTPPNPDKGVNIDGWAQERYCDPDDYENWPHCSWSIDEGADGSAEARFHSDESGNLDALASIVQRFLKKFRTDDWWSLTWANTCSAPRCDGFSGAGFVVTGKGVKWFLPDMDIEKYCSKLRKKNEEKTKRAKKAKKKNKAKA